MFWVLRVYGEVYGMKELKGKAPLHAAMGSPISPLIPNLFMEEFEVKALSSAPHPPAYG